VIVLVAEDGRGCVCEVGAQDVVAGDGNGSDSVLQRAWAWLCVCVCRGRTKDVTMGEVKLLVAEVVVGMVVVGAHGA
jgi:hypothetical protein